MWRLSRAMSDARHALWWVFFSASMVSTGAVARGQHVLHGPPLPPWKRWSSAHVELDEDEPFINSSSLTSGLNGAQDVSSVVSGWLVLSIGGQFDGPIERRLPGLAQSARSALSESLQVCQPSVRIMDMQSLVDGSALEEHARIRHRFAHVALAERAKSQLVQGIRQLMRRAKDPDALDTNFTRVRVSYEVRVFGEMRAGASEIADRIDGLQIYGRFVDLSRSIARSLFRFQQSELLENVLLDDVGYSFRREEPRPPMKPQEVVDCVEEGLLQDAREDHQYVVLFCCMLVCLIACAGSAVFALKQPSVVPSRANPLLSSR